MMNGKVESQVVYRFELRPVWPATLQAVPMPRDARVLSAGVKPGDKVISVWALCTHTLRPGPTRLKEFLVLCTGELESAELLRNTRFVNTCHLAPYVLHVFEMI